MMCDGRIRVSAPAARNFFCNVIFCGNLTDVPVLQPPLVQAIFSRNAEEVQLLLHKKEDVNALV